MKTGDKVRVTTTGAEVVVVDKEMVGNFYCCNEPTVWVKYPDGYETCYCVTVLEKVDGQHDTAAGG